MRPKKLKNLYKTQKYLLSKPALGARRRPGCRSELRRAKRAGAQTGIRALRGHGPNPHQMRKCQTLKVEPGDLRKYVQPLSCSGNFLI